MEEVKVTKFWQNRRKYLASKVSRKQLCATLLIRAALTAAPSFLHAPVVAAQDFPTPNITLIVPFPAGGGTDLFARGSGQLAFARRGLIGIIVPF